jgi:DNA gyrase/topoisomerase IV subunit A
VDPAIVERLDTLEAIARIAERKGEFLSLVAEAESADVARRTVMAAFSISESAATTVLGLQISRLAKDSFSRYQAERDALIRENE